MSPEADEREHRLHWLSLFFMILGSLRHVIWIVLISIFATRGGESGERLGYPLTIIGLSTMVAVIRYYSFRYRYDASELVIRTGIVRRNERHIPYDRIQNIDATANLLERFFGVVTVQLQTAGGRAPEGEFRVLPLAGLDEMRARVFAGPRASGVALADAPNANVAGTAGPPPAPEGRLLLHLTAGDLLLSGFIENRMFAAVVSGLVVFSRFDRFWKAVFGKIETVTGTGSVLAAVAAIVAALLLIRVASTIVELVRLNDFRVTRFGDDIRVEYGLFTRVTQTIPLRRVQAIAMHETLLHRLLGRAAVLVSSAGGGVGHSGRHHRELLAPIVSSAAAAALVEEVQPGARLSAVEWNRPHPHAFRRMMSRWSLVTGALALAASLLIGWWAAAAFGALFVAGLVRAWLTVRSLAWGRFADGVVYRTGALRRNTILARFARVQAVQFDESPIDRWTGMATVSIDTAGIGADSMRMPFAPRADAGDLFALVKSQSAGTEFVW